jgi:hypothetical protein
MNEPKYFRCNDRKRHLVSVFVCLHKKCPETECGFHRQRVLSNVEPKRDLPIPDPIDSVKPIKGIRARRKR